MLKPACPSLWHSGLRTALLLVGLACMVQMTTGAPVPVGVIYSFPLDTDPGWDVQGDWAFGMPQGQDGDPNLGHTGTSVYGYNLAGAYANNIPAYYLTAGPLDCSRYDNVGVSFWRWLGVEDAACDHATVEVSTDNAIWTTVWEHTGGSFQDTDWQQVSYDISTVADGAATVYLRWGMGPTDGSVTPSGWNIDDVEITGDIADSLSVTPDEGFTPRGHPGGPFAPGTAVYQLTNSGPVTVQWDVSHAQGWLQLLPMDGTLDAGASALLTANLTAAANDLPEGTYTDAIVFSNRTTGFVQARLVTLTVYTSPEIWVTPSSFTVTNVLNGNACRTLTIGNSGDGDLSFSLRSRQSAFTPLTGPRDVTLSGTTVGRTMVLEYTFAKPVVTSRDGYDYVSTEGLQDYLRTGAPIVPVRPATVLLPYGQQATAVRVSVVTGAKLDGTYRLPPAQLPTPLSHPEALRVVPADPAIYGQAVPWPGKNHEQLDVQSKRAYQLLTLSLLPLQYTPMTGQIAYAERLRVEVDLDDAKDVGVLRTCDQTVLTLANRVDNPQMLAAYPRDDLRNRKLSSAAKLAAGGPYEYVVVTTPDLAAAAGPWNFQALCDARLAQGLSATIIDTDWIYANYDGTRPDGGTDNPTCIRNFLIDAYQTWGTRYVLLGGTAALVPPRQFWVDSYAGEIDEMPVDMYYGCVEPAACTFDGDADGVYGEPADGVGGGDVDLEAEIYVGRAAVENATELANFVRKTLTYDQTTSDYLPRVSMVGEYLGFGGISDYATSMMEQVRLGGSDDGYATVGFENHTQPDFYDFDTSVNLYDSPTNDWPKADLLALMDRGTHVFNHLGHASETYTMKVYTSDLPALTNTDYFFVYSQGCYPGSFDTANCFAEEITAMDHGAFAVVMNARYGWGSRNSTDAPSQRFDRQYWDAVLDENMLEMGRANQDSKEDNLWDINGACIRWCYYELTLFGDPAQRFRFAVSPDWIGADPVSGTVAPGTSTNVQVRFDAGVLDAGIYEGEIVVVSDDPDTPSIRVPCAMTVLPDDLEVTPSDALESSGYQRGPFAPASKTYTLTNKGGLTLDWGAICASNWMTVVPAGGTLSAGQTGLVSVSLNANANGLGPGTYGATVIFTNRITGAAQLRAVHMVVLERVLDHFAWDPIAPTQYVGSAFSVRVTAQDATGLTVTNYAGTVGLTGLQSGLTTDRILGEPIHTESADAGSDTFTVGYSFTPADSITVTHVRHYFGMKVSIWTDDGVLLAAQNVGSVPGTWSETALAMPVQLSAGTRYRVGACFTGACHLRTDMPAAFGHGTIGVSYEGVGDTFPTTADTARWWFVDLAYMVEAAVSVGIAPASSDSFVGGVWAGEVTVLQPATDMHLKADDGTGHAGTSAVFSVVSAPLLHVALPLQVREGDGVLTGVGRVSIPSPLASSLSVTVSASDTTELRVPARVTIPAGQTGVAFSAMVIDDTETDGSQVVTVAATVAGYAPARTTLTVLDNDLYRFGWGAISSPQTRGLPFVVTINALDYGGACIPSYGGRVTLTATGNHGPVLLSPTGSGVFVAGRWSGPLSVDTADTLVQLTASDDVGHSGTSSVFDVRADGPSTLYAFDLDTDPGWLREGEWQFGLPMGQGGDLVGFADPLVGFTGVSVLGVNLQGDYSTQPGGPYSLTTGPLDFTGYANITLRFQRWLNTDFDPYARVAVEISTDGTHWTPVWSNDALDLYEDAWGQVEYLLPTADNAAQAYVRWTYEVGPDAWAASGWNIDDIAFVGEPNVAPVTSHGTPLSWLRSYGLTNFDWEVEDHLDVDGDGKVAWEEYVCDTIPTSRVSVLALLGVQLGVGGAEVKWKGGANATQYLERTGSLLPPKAPWTAFFTNIPPTSITNAVPDDAGAETMRFYRVRAVR